MKKNKIFIGGLLLGIIIIISGCGSSPIYSAQGNIVSTTSVSNGLYSPMCWQIKYFGPYSDNLCYQSPDDAATACQNRCLLDLGNIPCADLRCKSLGCMKSPHEGGYGSPDFFQKEYEICLTQNRPRQISTGNVKYVGSISELQQRYGDD